MYDEQDEQCNHEGLGSIAEENHDGLRRYITINIGQSCFDMKQTDDLRVFSAAGQWKFSDNGPGRLSLATENRQSSCGRADLSHLRRAHGGQAQYTFKLLLD